MRGSLSNCIGVDDAPFDRAWKGDVVVYGCVFAGTRLDGVLTTKVRKDGANATTRIADMILASPFRGHVRAILLQGIAVAGFNVVDVHRLHALTSLPVLVVARRPPDLDAMRRALHRVPGGARKARLLARAGPMEPLRGVMVQRVGLDRDQAARTLAATTLHGKLPEPLRAAHLIAGGVATGTSRGRA